MTTTANSVIKITKRKAPTTKVVTKVVTLLTNTSQVTFITENCIDPSPVPVLASDDFASTNNHLIQTWSMQFLLKPLMDPTTFTDHPNNCQTYSTSTAMKNRNKYEPKFNLHVVQVKQYTVDSHHP